MFLGILWNAQTVDDRCAVFRHSCLLYGRMVARGDAGIHLCGAESCGSFLYGAHLPDGDWKYVCHVCTSVYASAGSVLVPGASGIRICGNCNL